MALNCRVGDLAYVVGPVSTPGLRGRLVIVKAPATLGTRYPRLDSAGHVRSWECESAGHSSLPWLMTSSGEVAQVRVRIIADCFLRPIRPNDGEVEILRIAGKPIKETA